MAQTTPENCPFPLGICIPSNPQFLGPTQVSIQNGISIGSAVLHSSPYSVPLLYNGSLRFPQKLPLPLGGSGPHLTHGIGPTQVINPNGILIGSAFLYGSQMLQCTTHCQWARKTPKLPLPLGISSHRQRRTEPRP